ncbi:MAG TPA: hypothetical protein VE869_09650 [Gemmatimonas sp.]|nr:hypothetical protein [Gemmatimonas sp.]
MRRIVALALLTACAAVACGGDRDAGDAPPAVEFLLAAGDSTYWVRGGPEGVRVRSAPILLTNVDGQFYEVYITGSEEEYDDASFATARVWSRRVLGTDSVLLFHDSTVLQQAARWKRRHPGEPQLDPETDDLSENPRTMVSEDIEIVDVHGPWLAITHVLDVDTETGDDHQHRGYQRVVHVRTGKVAALDDLIGIAEARRIIARAQSSFAGIVDSIRVVEDERAELARESLDSFRFDSTSFAITSMDGAPAIAFMVPGSGTDGEPIAMHLPPIAVLPPAWWSGVRSALPEFESDSSERRWERNGYRVLARPSADGESLALVLQVKRSARDSVEWPVTTVPAPAYQLLSLDSPATSAATRSALARAFDRSKALDGLVQQAAYVRPSKGRAVRGAVHRR